MTAPFIGCALALFRGWGRRAPALRSFVLLLLCAGVLNFAFLMLMNAAVYRYTADFLPYLALAGSLGFLALVDGRRPGWAGAGSTVAALLLLAFSVASSLCAAFALDDLTRFEIPRFFRGSAGSLTSRGSFGKLGRGRRLASLGSRPRFPPAGSAR